MKELELEKCCGDIDDSADVEVSATINAAIISARRELSGKGREKCLGCDEVIPKERREFIPGCCYCIKCQGKFDRNRESRSLHLSFDAVEESDLTPEEEEFANKCLNAKD